MIKELYGIRETYLFDVKIVKIRNSARYKKRHGKKEGKKEREDKF